MVYADLIGLQILILYPVGLQIRLNIRKSLSYRSTKKLRAPHFRQNAGM